MDTGAAARLRRNRDRLVSDMMPDIIVDRLFQSDIFSDEDVEVVKSRATPQAKNREILDLLPRRGPSAYEAFCEALAPDFPWLVDELESVDLSRPVREVVPDYAEVQPGAIEEELTHDAISFLTNSLLSSGSHSDWKFFARRLGLTEDIIRGLEYRYPRDIRQQIYEAIVQWKMTEGRRATIERVCRALREENRFATADDLRRRYGGG